MPRDQVDSTDAISQATWDAVATHEVTAQQGADRARALLRRMLQSLPLDREASERSEAAERLVREQVLARSLGLLLLAEQCRVLYRSLKLDQVRRTEPGALDGEITAAQRLLAENEAADRKLIAQLHEAINRLGRIGPLDGVRLFTRSKLPRLVAALQDEVERFARQRQLQLESWPTTATPDVGDAVREIAARVHGGARAGRNHVGSAIEQAGRRLQDTKRPPDGETPPNPTTTSRRETDVPTQVPVLSDPTRNHRPTSQSAVVTTPQHGHAFATRWYSVTRGRGAGGRVDNLTPPAAAFGRAVQ